MLIVVYLYLITGRPACNNVRSSDQLGIIYTLKYIIIFSHFTFTFSHLADAFIQSDLQLGST